MKVAFYRWLIGLIALPSLFVWALLSRRKTEKELIWGVVPIINLKYWSRMFSDVGIPSETLVTHHYHISSRSDFDVYYEDLVPKGIEQRAYLSQVLRPYFAFAYLVSRASVFHGYFDGGPLGATPFAWAEPWLLKIAGIKTVMTPYGGDSWIYSEISDPDLREALESDYPQSKERQRDIARQVDRWNRHADAILTGTAPDRKRNDCYSVSPLSIDTTVWKSVETYSDADGVNGAVRIIHTPNHRRFKGTQYVIEAVQRLKDRGLKIDLDLVEGVSNVEVARRMREADILVEQLIFRGYALSAVEGMVTGITVVSNLTDSPTINNLRRNSYLNECPIEPASRHTIEDVLESLIRNPERRKMLGQAGRKYVEKYHSYEAGRALFVAVHDKILGRKDVDLKSLFLPTGSGGSEAAVGRSSP